MAIPAPSRSVSQNIPRIRGLIFSLDPRAVQEIHVLGGQNFFVDPEGPRAAFGSHFITISPLRFPEVVVTINGNDERFIFGADAIYSYDSDTQTYYSRYTFAPVDDYYPWTLAYVNKKYFFTRKGVPVIVYNTVDNSWKTLVDVSLPSNIVAVTQAMGRLVVVGEDRYAWSALDNGEDLTPSLTTGAGNQGMSIIGGKAQFVIPIEEGFIVYSTKGLIRSTNSGTNATFRHRVIKDALPALNPAMIAYCGANGTIYLTRQGFIKIDTSNATVWEPLASNYFAENLMGEYPDNLSTMPPAFKFFYAQDLNALFISVMDLDNPGQYAYAYVYNFNLQEWGEFHHQHYSFVNVQQYADTNPILYETGFIAIDGTVRHVGPFDHAYSHDWPNEAFIFWQPLFQPPVTTINDEHIFPCAMRFMSYDVSELQDQPAGLYAFSFINSQLDGWDSPEPANTSTNFVGYDYMAPAGDTYYDFMAQPDGFDDFMSIAPRDNIFPSMLNFYTFISIATIVAVPPKYVSLNSFIEVGLLRATDQTYPNIVSLTTDLAIGAGDPTLYNAYVRGSIDGKNTYEENFEQLYPVQFTDDIAYYKPYNFGVYHSMLLTTEKAYDTFHLHFFEGNAILAGHL